MNPATSPLSESSATDTTTDLLIKLQSTPEKAQFQVIQELGSMGEAGLSALMAFLLKRCGGSRPADLPTEAPELASGRNLKPDLVAGKVYQVLFTADVPTTLEFLQTHFPTGIVPLRSQTGIDYRPLQELLAKQDFLAADQLTLQKLCELAGSAAIQRKWIYFTEVEQFPIPDLHTINALWLVHSTGQFGFSVQRDIWLSVGKSWEKLWSEIGWKTDNTWTRYPQEFTWTLNAPKGHLPLSNQLRGVRVIASLMAHPAWSEGKGE